MRQHTPGPWQFADHQSHCQITDETGFPLAEVYGRSAFGRELCEANAALICAAPALLAACEALHARLFREQGGQENSRWAAPLELLRRAIAAARGTASGPDTLDLAP